ncbi:hypothetical protein [Mesorhizobium sp. B2-4-6]|uniref:hypothetical protein n=1 Tax=Mesorhizobium sp. B2-4-6 TaxID=2589943 RepID=UPI0011260477|nr:hypothetical protein [Mesorhizobium sp. B2-4-6]TPL40772.1 hypothetical protein FJ957_26480 [Mesorhizobium sp. B2-4-6]
MMIATPAARHAPLSQQAEPAGDFTRALIQVLSPDDPERAIEHTCRSLRPGGVIYITGSGIIEDDR